MGSKSGSELKGVVVGKQLCRVKGCLGGREQSVPTAWVVPRDSCSVMVGGVS